MKHPRMILSLLAGFVIIIASPLSAQSSLEADPVQQSSRQEDPRLARNMSLAYSLHELAFLYIKRGEADKGMVEARRLLELDLPAQYEQNVIESMAILANGLGEMRRFDLAQLLLDETLKKTAQSANQAKVFKTKARLFRLAGNDDRAIERWKRAIEIEEGTHRPGIPK